MKCPVAMCSNSCKCLSGFGIFGAFLVLALVIFFTGTNQSLFLAINSKHEVLPVVVWEVLNFVSYRKFMILPVLLLIITYIWRREKLLNIILLIISYFVVFGVLKVLFGEARPYMVFDPKTFYWLNMFEDAKGSAFHSFPSGHVGNIAMFAFAISAMFFQNKRSLQFLMLLVVVITGFARICTGWHWPLDVIASGLIGYLLVKLCLCVKLRK